MLTRSRRPLGLRERLGNFPWWVYILLIPTFYLLGWGLHLLGLIPKH